MSRPKHAADWQAAIYAKHPHWIAGHHPHMAVGDGWAEVLARLFDRIAEALAGEPVPVKVAIVDIKEKYAELRAELLAPVGPETQAVIDRAILLAEMRSECTCDECGREGRLRSTLGQSGWLAVKCDIHASGYPRLVAKGPPRRRVRDRRGDYEVVYDRVTDAVVETPVDDMDSR
ncbi:hypothetical protein [Bosea sp. TND4EK4]|uniref:hypothetical protein n=1 Tax=Bosea sp. TND4EK4 TaxID=1907408 RepID=UPI0009552F59|nr:hypothetical protein [Bosea sp. TND4EK4]SIR28461.1 hypothetical protein SAMN05880592_11474 [Bosea sp. TND4EK4]